MSGFPEYANYDALGLAELVRKKEVTPLELVEEAISRIEQHNPKLNAVIYNRAFHHIYMVPKLPGTLISRQLPVDRNTIAA